MIPDLTDMLASFTRPMDIPTNPASMLWMFPVLLAIATVYKATKIRVIFLPNFIRQVVILFATVSVFMVFLGVVLIFFVQLITG